MLPLLLKSLFFTHNCLEAPRGVNKFAKDINPQEPYVACFYFSDTDDIGDEDDVTGMSGKLSLVEDIIR